MSDVNLEENLLEVEGEIYNIKPGADKAVVKYFGEDHGYRSAAEKAQAKFERETIDTTLVKDHIKCIPNLLPAELCQSLIEEFEGDPEGIQHESVAEVLLTQVFTDEIDAHIRSYFGSEYCVFWWSIYKIESTDEETGYSTKWHCDGGPEKHLKVITYLNGFDEHGSDTAYLDKEATDKLKEVGYIFASVEKRSLNIEPLCKKLNVDYQPMGVKPAAGDTIIFNPFEIAHRAKTPVPGKPRYALNFCLVPSEIHWKTVAEQYYFPAYDCQDFRKFAPIVKKITKDQALDLNYVEVGLNFQVENLQHARFIIENVIKTPKPAWLLVNYLERNDPTLVSITSIFDLLRFIKKVALEQLHWEKFLQAEWLDALKDISSFEQNFNDSRSRYSQADKPNPNAIFWPSPVHEKYPQSKFEILPYVRKEPIMDLDTPIGSAGSCFAFEIAKYFQTQGYNYVISERNDDPNSGVFVDGYQPGDELVKFCANYGIMFNSPSFTQLAEKAFGHREFSKLLFQNETGYFLDPYREGVVFSSKEAYFADYDKHIAALRDTFLSCKVFVLTMGLNECWQLTDGTLMSRNPRENMFHLVKHRTLTVQENVDYIQRFFDIIKAHNPDFKLIISVSPIPFLATGRAEEQHIISANCHSKSVLRVAADELVNNNEDMYYLPSYELVTECIEDAWDIDHRHVKSETVEKVVAMFKEIFVR